MENNVLKDFLFGGMAVVFVLWQLIPMNEIGGDYAATAVNALFSDSNVVIVITFILALVGCVAILSGVCLSLTVVYIFKKQFRDNVNRKLKND
ncbi:hypothetical protein PXT12_004917 [Salmonella enterica]|nr:hypothetical protein [Salmonella enterica]ELI6866174.1 hypothetical protein [Salmonella enterica]